MFSRRDAGLLERVFYALLLRGAYADKVLQEQAIRESDLDYSIVRPTRLTTAAGAGRYTPRVGPGPGRISQAGKPRPLAATFWWRKMDSNQRYGLPYCLARIDAIFDVEREINGLSGQEKRRPIASLEAWMLGARGRARRSHVHPDSDRQAHSL